MTDTRPLDALVIGAGPAGLMAAEELARRGRKVMVVDAKPSFGRKFLMAGKSGLNLTKNEPLDAFLGHFGADAAHLAPMITQFGPAEAMQWANDLGQTLFTGSTGRVFPTVMKASPLLRAWLARLASFGVVMTPNWRWTGLKDNRFHFETPHGTQFLAPTVTVLACGGASWRRLGSDGAWASLLPDASIADFAPANMGFTVDWSAHMAPHFGQAVKGIAMTAGAQISRGEIVLTKTGLEGGGIYTLSKALREGAPLTIDLLPDLSLAEITARLAKPRGKATLSNHLRKSLKLDPVKLALLLECARPLPPNSTDIGARIKSLRLPLTGTVDIDRAISTAGGLCFDGLDQDLMIRAYPGIFAAGEMLDWEAPTGGYLLTTCLATGLWAGQNAARWQG